MPASAKETKASNKTPSGYRLHTRPAKGSFPTLEVRPTFD